MNCKNCHTQLKDNQNYCSECGAKVIVERITLKNIFEQFNEQFLSIDNRLLKTFLHLFSKPKEVIDGYINGLRNRYSNVISYLAVALTLYGFQFFIMKKFFSEDFTSSASQIASNSVNEEMTRKINEGIFEYMGLITIAFIPIMALITYLIFYKRQYNYSEHIVINTYIIAQYTILTFFTFFISALFGLDIPNNFLIGAVISYLYMSYALKRLFDLSVLGTVWRIIAIIALYVVVFLIISAILGIVAVIFMKAFKG